MTGLAPVLEVALDPAVRIGDLLVRWHAIVVSLAVLVALLVATTRTRLEVRSWDLPRLRPDDLLYITLGSLPGAFLGGRVVHALAYLDAYAAAPARLFDPGVGGFSLTGAVIGGAVTGLYVASLLEGAARRWAEVAALPLLLALAFGKVGQFLAGGGQGASWDGPWAVAFTGAGPWLGSAPGTPAHPVALYEAIWYAAGIAVVVRGGRALRDSGWVGVGGSFVVALCWFLAGRAVLGTFWRDDRQVGPLNVEQTVAILVLGGIVAATAQVVLRRQDRARAAQRAGLVPPKRGRR